MIEVQLMAADVPVCGPYLPAPKQRVTLCPPNPKELDKGVFDLAA